MIFYLGALIVTFKYDEAHLGRALMWWFLSNTLSRMARFYGHTINVSLASNTLSLEYITRINIWYDQMPTVQFRIGQEKTNAV